jgi:hypothetical protein
VGAEHGANIITAIVTIFGERTFQRKFEYFNRHCDYCYTTVFKHPEISIFRNTAITNIRKYQEYIVKVCTVEQ